MRTFWLLVLYGARRLCPMSAVNSEFPLQHSQSPGLALEIAMRRT